MQNEFKIKDNVLVREGVVNWMLSPVGQSGTSGIASFNLIVFFEENSVVSQAWLPGAVESCILLAT